jgi:hypothetical protein
MASNSTSASDSHPRQTPYSMVKLIPASKSLLQGAGDVTGLSNEAQRKQKGPASTGPSKTLELQP